MGGGLFRLSKDCAQLNYFGKKVTAKLLLILRRKPVFFRLKRIGGGAAPVAKVAVG
jgi:hypothetical protein